MEELPSRQRVSQAEIQQRFNAGGYWQRAQRGELKQRVLKDRACRLPSEPPGTRSQIVAYYEDINRVALVHQYLRPDGTIGASGLPDPKELREEGVIYFI